MQTKTKITDPDHEVIQSAVSELGLSRIMNFVSRANTWRVLICALLFLGIVSVTGCDKKQGVYHEQFLEFGTMVEIKIWGVSEKQGQQAVAKIAADFHFLHRVWHAWKPGTLNRVNELIPTGEKFSIGPSVLPLIKRGKILAHESGDLFNPAIGALIKLWGFASDNPPKGPPPTQDQISAILNQHPTMQNITLNGIEMQSNNPSVQLDFGGYAKGFAVDLAIQQLQDMQIQNAIVNAGGDLRAIGKHGPRPWRVGIRNPRGDGVIASVEVEGDESVFTSGDYERFFTWEGKRYHHIIDPRNGYPATAFSSVTIFDDDAATADAAATAVFVAGEEKWLDVARNMKVDGVMIVTASGGVYMTPNLKNRIKFETDPPPTVVLSDAL